MAEASTKTQDVPTPSLKQLEVADEDDPSCTVQELDNIITAPAGGLTMLPSRSVDEVYPGVFIGDRGSAINTVLLKRLGINHVLNTANGPSDGYHVNTNADIYSSVKIDYYPIEATDHMNFTISKYFDETSDYIERALAKKGRVLVHCKEGCSRSATITLAFLMIKRHMCARDAMRHVRSSREICPNDGFLEQLCKLNDQLIEAGHFKAHDTVIKGDTEGTEAAENS